MKMAANFKPYLNQDYEKLRQECLKSKTLFVDKEFPPNAASLYRKTKPSTELGWKRASELIKNPQFIVDGITPEDLDQGILGDCWLISAIANIASKPEYANVVIPKDQSFAPGEYAGIFHFRFWQYGEWYDVVVDDHLPVKANTSQLVFCHNNKDANEMFGPLIEKAYAKLYMYYENLISGQVRDATTDLTGGLQQQFTFRNKDNNIITQDELWEAMSKAFLLKSLAGLSKDTPKDAKANSEDPSGIITSHAYSCLSSYEILYNNGKYDKIREFKTDSDFKPKDKSIRLVKCRNPWGKQISYKGPWSNGTSEWNKVEQNIKDLLAPAKMDDGQFYMSFEDMFKIFDDISFIHLDMNAFYLKDYTYNKSIVLNKWSTESHRGKWSPETSGAKDYWNKQQFRFEVKTKTLVVLSLFQTDAIQFKNDGKRFNSCGVDVYKIRDPSSKKPKYAPTEIEKAYNCKFYFQTRENITATVLEPGSYIALVGVLEEGVTNGFYLRIMIRTEEPSGGKSSTNVPSQPVVADVKPNKPAVTEVKNNTPIVPVVPVVDSKRFMPNQISKTQGENYSIQIYSVLEPEKIHIYPYKDQNSERIAMECLRDKKLFEDPLFKASVESITKRTNINQLDKITWKRPHEIVKDPKFIVNSIQPSDLSQGKLNDNWFISGLASVTTSPDAIRFVVPTDQSFDANKYTGMFHFRFWMFGEWFDVVVDDRLPVDEKNSLIFCKNMYEPNEMFGPLIEKAYAKINSCYHYLDGGDPIDAIVDLTSGVSEEFLTKKPAQAANTSIDEGVKWLEPKKLWEVMFQSVKRQTSFAISFIHPDAKFGFNAVKPNGLIVGVNYTVLTVYELYADKGSTFNQFRDPFDNSYKKDTKSIKLVLISNNSSNTDAKWTGRWNADSKQDWAQVSDSIQKNLLENLKHSKQEFLISFDDLIQEFDQVEFVHTNMNAFFDVNSEFEYGKRKWMARALHGTFVPGENSGGVGWPSYWCNPQYLIEIKSSRGNQGKLDVIVDLIQTDHVKLRDETGGIYENSSEALGFSIYSIKNELSDNVVAGQRGKFTESELVERFSSGNYISKREVSRKFEIPTGTYVIIPSVYQKDKELSYLLRVFLEEEEGSSLNQDFELVELEAKENKPIPVVTRADDHEKRPVKPNPKQNQTSKACTIL